MDCDHPAFLCPPSCDHCLAYDRLTRSLCVSPTASSSSKWCSVHEEIQAKSLKTYKRYTQAVELLDSTLLSPSSLQLSLSSTDSVQLRFISELSRNKWILIQRVIAARQNHHNQFYMGGDFGHNEFIGGLTLEKNRLENLMVELNSIAYQLILVQADADWVRNNSNSFTCDEESVVAPPTPPASPPSSNELLCTTASQRKKASRKSRKELETFKGTSWTDLAADCGGVSVQKVESLNEMEILFKLRDYLKLPKTHFEFIENIFRFVILKTPSLATLALSPSTTTPKLTSIDQFLDLLEQRAQEGSTQEITTLYQALKFTTTQPAQSTETKALLGVGILSDCLMDVGRVKAEGDAALEILGGYIYKIPNPVMTLDKFKIFYSMIACAGCALSVTTTYLDWMNNRRLALSIFPDWLTPGENELERLFRKSKMMICGSNFNSCGSKVTSVGGKRGSGIKSVSVEEWERAWISLRAPIDDEWTDSFLAKLESLPNQFTVLARNGKTLKYLTDPTAIPKQSCRCSPLLSKFFTASVRSGKTPAARKIATFTPSTYFPPTTILDSFSESSSRTEKRFGYDFSGECYQILVLDARPFLAGRNWSEFSARVEEVLLASAVGNSKEEVESFDVSAMDLLKMRSMFREKY